MKKILAIFAVFLLFSVVVLASIADARQTWLEARETHIELQQEWREAQQLVARENTPENVENVVNKAKVSLNSGLDEAIAFFELQKEKLTTADVSDDLKQTIESDLNKNIDAAEALKDDVNSIQTRVEVGITSLKILDAYLNLLVDVMRDSGFVYVEKARLRVEKLEQFRDMLQEKVNLAPESKKQELEGLMDDLNKNIQDAKDNIDEAEDNYKSITQKEGSRLKFQQGNTNIMQSRNEMLMAFQNIQQIVQVLRR